MTVTRLIEYCAGALLLIATAAAGAHTNRNLIDPFIAHYEVNRGALALGNATFSLDVTEQLGCYVYTGHANPNLLAQIFIGAITQKSRFCLQNGRVRPLFFKRHVEGDKEESYTLRFDWSQNVIHYKNELGETRTMHFTGHPLDALSLQIAVRRWIDNADNPAKLGTRTFKLVDEDDIETFTLSVKGTQKITVPAGRFPTLIVTEINDDDPLRFWLARNARWIPIRVQKSSGSGSFQLSMQRLIIDGRVID